MRPPGRRIGQERAGDERLEGDMLALADALADGASASGLALADRDELIGRLFHRLHALRRVSAAPHDDPATVIARITARPTTGLGRGDVCALADDDAVDRFKGANQGALGPWQSCTGIFLTPPEDGAGKGAGRARLERWSVLPADHALGGVALQVVVEGPFGDAMHAQALAHDLGTDLEDALRPALRRHGADY